jgi:hypothetical protein
MKTRVWQVTTTIHDRPGYDERGQSIPYLTKKQLKEELTEPQCAGVSVVSTEVKLVGHLPAPLTTRRLRKPYSIKLVPHKGRGARKAVKS